jgi:cell division protein FtsN
MNYDFSLDRKSTVVLSAGSVLLIVLVFVAGFLAGMSWRTEPRTIIASQRTTVAPASTTSPSAQSAKAPASGDPPKTGTTQAARPAEEPATPPIPKPAEPDPVSVPVAATSAAVASARAPEQSGVRLSIQVGSFLERANAQKLADELTHLGYNPQIVIAGSGPKQWSIVRVGPYLDWDEATHIAALLSRDQTSPAVIRPIR